MALRRSGQPLHMHQLVGLHGQLSQIGAKGFGNDLFGFVQVRAGIDQINGGLHRHRAPHLGQDGGHRIGMNQDVFARVQHLAGNQGLGKGAGLGQDV